MRKRLGHEQEVFQVFDRVPGSPGGEEMMGGFALNMICHQLLMLEERIILAEHRPGPVIDVEEERGRYVHKRGIAEKIANFQQVYEKSREEHNECARINLNNSDGTVYVAVVPKFNSDGTHEPWGEWDVPWNSPPNRQMNCWTKTLRDNVFTIIESESEDSRKDFYTLGIAKTFGVSVDRVTPEMRHATKTLCFFKVSSKQEEELLSIFPPRSLWDYLVEGGQ